MVSSQNSVTEVSNYETYWIGLFCHFQMFQVFSVEILCTFIAICLALAYFTPFLKSNPKIRALHNCLNKNHFNLSEALAICKDLSVQDLNNNFTKVPLLQYLLHLLGTTRTYNFRNDVIQLVTYVIDRGVDLNIKSKNTSYPIQEALMMRELSICYKMLEAGSNIINIEILLLIYSIPFGLVYYSKLFLQAHELVCQTISNDTYLLKLIDLGKTFYNSNFTEEYLFDTILLSCEDKNILTHHDLYSMSKSYQTLIHKMRPIRKKTKIYLIELLNSFSECSGIIHNLLLEKILNSNQCILLFSQILCQHDKNNRNALHMLALAGSNDMIIQLISFYKNIINNNNINNNQIEEFLSYLSDALSMRDKCHQTPLSYTKSRFRNTYIEDSMRNLARICFDSEDYIDHLFEQQGHEFHAIPTKDDEEILARKKLCELASQDSGGWDYLRIPSTIIPEDTRCDMLEIWGDTPHSELFISHYVSAGRPVVFRGAALNDKLRTSFTKNNFLSKYGSRNLPVATIPYASSFGIDMQDISFEELANVALFDGQEEFDSSSSNNESNNGDNNDSIQPPVYAFSALRSKEDPISLDAPPPPCLNAVSRISATQFYLGCAGSGAPSHFHGSAVNVLAYGKKVSNEYLYLYFYNCIIKYLILNNIY